LIIYKTDRGCTAFIRVEGTRKAKKGRLKGRKVERLKE
jgi:hypothetical protein